MFGLYMPTGEIYLMLKSGKKDSIEMTDLIRPKKEIMEDKYLLEHIKKIGYKNIDGIIYERNGNKVIVPIADYYAEHGQELEN